MTPNMLWSILCKLTAATEAGVSVSVTKRLELFSICDSGASGTFTAYPNLASNLIQGLPILFLSTTLLTWSSMAGQPGQPFLVNIRIFFYFVV